MSRNQTGRSTAPDLKQQTRDSLEFPTVLQFFACRTQTEEGRKRLLALDLMAPAELETHYHLLEQWLEYLSQQDPLRFPAIPSQSFFQRKPEFKPFDAAELRTVRDLLAFRKVVLETTELGFVAEGCIKDGALDQLSQKCSTLFLPDGRWRLDISPTYAALVRQLVQTQRNLDETFAALMRRYAEYLNESIVYERNHRRVLAVKLNFKGRVKGILQDYSSSGSTVYMEPEQTVSQQNRLIELEKEIEEELWRIRVALTREILAFPLIHQVLCPHLAAMDMLQGLARVAGETGSQALCPNQNHVLTLLQARHPFLDQHFAELRRLTFEDEAADHNRMIAFCLSLDDQTRGLIISGANTGGKTVTLKTTGLLAWMANSGLPVPVDEGSAIPYYRTIFADIGDHQSLSHNLSTFASHLANMNQVLSSQESHALILLDELGSGTDPNEGNALAMAILEELCQRGLHLMATTHQQILCTMALNHPHLENGSMAFDVKRLLPTYRFSQGVPGRSHALETAANSGLPSGLLARARQLIDDDMVDIQAAIRQLQEQNKVLRKQQQKLRKDELRLHRRIQEAKKEQDELALIKEELREKARLKLGKAVEKAEKELRTVLNDVSTTRQRKSGLAKFSKIRNEIMEPLAKEPAKLADLHVETSGQEQSQWQVGDRVLIKSWMKEATLLSLDRKKARVDCNGMVVTVEVGDLLHLLSSKAKNEAGRVSEFVETAADDDTLSVELRLLGFRVEDALLELEHTLDAALRKGIPFLKIIHGHGSGALKQAVRSYLQKHVARNSFEVNLDKQNDGVTDLKFTL